MKRFSLLTSLLVLSGPLLAAPGHTDDNQAYFAILAETKVSRMAGVKLRAMPKLPPGIHLPAGAMAMFSSAPAHTLNFLLWSPSIAPDGATATVAPPAGLQLGNLLNLELYRPTPEESTNGGTSSPGNPSQANPDFTIKIYWGSSPTVKDGQPKIIHFGDFTPEQKLAMQKKMSEMHPGGGGSSYFYKPNWTTGYWPTSTEPGDIPDGASLVGKYSLTTSYTGNVDIEAPSDVDFLAGINLTSPDLSQKPDLTQAIPLQWDAIPNVLGQDAAIFGMEDEHTIIVWNSSEVYQDRMMADLGFLQMSEVKDFVNQTIFMPGTQTQTTVPAGIFSKCEFVSLSMAGYGPGSALDAAQPLPRIQTKTTLSVMLGGSKMRGMGGG